MQCSYWANGNHDLYLGTRLAASGAEIAVKVDGGAPVALDLSKPGEDILVRLPVGMAMAPGQHTVTITHTGEADTVFYFDFLELAYPTTELPNFEDSPRMTLATDWDTDHSLAIAPERTAWLMRTLGFRGRANHYAGAMWFYELHRVDHTYSSGSITFSGEPEFGKHTTIFLGPTPIDHVNLIGDTAETVATCVVADHQRRFHGRMGRRRMADSLTITSRAMGALETR